MNKVQGVSLPRCGHNLLVKHLLKFFSRSEVCPDYRQVMLPFLAKAKMRRESTARLADPQAPHRFHYCEYYYSCRSIPCCNAANHFQKSHDFELQIPATPNQSYIIQTRNRLGLLISWFELRLPPKREVDFPEGFVSFAHRMMPYLNGFHKKWIEDELPNRLIIDYDDYLTEPQRFLKRAIKMFAPEATFDQNSFGKSLKMCCLLKMIQNFAITMQH